MLKKLLKYDFKYIFKYWWMGALISFLLALAGGGCIRILDSVRSFPSVVNTAAILILVLAVIGLIAFLILSVALVFVRFHKNFFTDEGYLTFTLPVKTSSLLNSKLISGVVTGLLTSIVMVVEVLIMLWSGFGNVVFKDIGKLISRAFDEEGAILALYIFEGLLIGIALTVLTTLITYICITFSRVLTKKIRVVAAIGVYYVVNSAFSFITQMFLIFGTQSLAGWMAPLSDGQVKLAVAMMLLGMLLFLVMLCTLLHILQSYMLDRKLNLA